MSFEVKIDVFEGPFDLLLQLIMKQELDIHEVPVAAITSAFIEQIESSPELDLDTATEFLLIAATLLLIKARSLLPQPEDDRELPKNRRTPVSTSWKGSWNTRSFQRGRFASSRCTPSTAGTCRA